MTLPPPPPQMTDPWHDRVAAALMPYAEAKLRSEMARDKQGAPAVVKIRARAFQLAAEIVNDMCSDFVDYLATLDALLAPGPSLIDRLAATESEPAHGKRFVPRGAHNGRIVIDIEFDEDEDLRAALEAVINLYAAQQCPAALDVMMIGPPRPVADGAETHVYVDPHGSVVRCPWTAQVEQRGGVA